MESLIPWILFNSFVLGMLALDLGVFHKKCHVVNFKEAVIWSAVWIGLALAFNLGVYLFRGPQTGLEFLTGYLIEKALSVDNIFVFIMIFAYFKVPALYQHKVLFWGIVGALVMRAIFIAAGITLLKQFHWLIYIFGAFLILTGIKMGLKKDEEIHPENNPLIKLCKKIIPVTHSYEGGNFFTRISGRLYATPLFLTLVLVEFTDVIFAVDSIPAILAVTEDPFIVYSSNVFAILGMRSLYFALAGSMNKFHFLHYGLAGILVFVGIKMTLADIYKIPVFVSLATIMLLLVLSIGASKLWPQKSSKV